MENLYHSKNIKPFCFEDIMFQIGRERFCYAYCINLPILFSLESSLFPKFLQFISMARQLSWLERRANNAKVTGSIPLRANKFFFSVLDLFSYQRILHHYPLVQNRASQQQKCEKNKGLRSIFKSLQAKSGKNKIASALWPFYTYTHSIRTFHSYAQQDKDTQLRMLLFQK